MIAPVGRALPAGRAATPSRGSALAEPAVFSDGAIRTDDDAIAFATDAGLAAAVTREPTAGDAALDAEREAFEFALKVQAEHERELNALRDLAMEQVKRDDETLKKWIALI